MPRFFLWLLLALTPVWILAEEPQAKPEVKPDRIPDATTPLPWHLVNLWWTMPVTDNFESLEIDFSINEDVDPAKLNLYIAPIGLGQINGVSFYGGIQTNIGGYPVSDASPQGQYHKGKGGIFSRWGNKDLDTSFVRPALDGLTEAAGYEGDFASGRRPFDWKAGKYTYALRKLNYEKDAEGREWTWVGAFVTEQATAQTKFISALKFPGRTLKFWGRHSAFIEIYSGKKVVISELPKLEIHIGMPRVNGQAVKVEKLDVNFPRRSKDPASPALMTAELDNQEVVCKLKNEILTREKWAYPLIK